MRHRVRFTSYGGKVGSASLNKHYLTTQKYSTMDSLRYGRYFVKKLFGEHQVILQRLS